MTEAAPQREHPQREVVNGLGWFVRTGAQWRMLPQDGPPWYTGYQQTQRWLVAGVLVDQGYRGDAAAEAAAAEGIRREVVRVPATLGGLPFLALAILVLHRFVALMADSP